jgi:hypothetical protein
LIVQGRLFEFVLLIAGVALIIFSIRRAAGGKVPKIRRIVCLDALEQLVARAAEMGTAIHFATGASTLDSAEAPIIAAGLAVLGHVSELCGKYNVPIRYTCIYGYMIPLAQDIIKHGYAAAGVPDRYNDDMVVYAGDSQISYLAAMMGYISREKPASSMLFGGIKYETMNVLGAASIAGCMQAAGTPRLYYQPFLVACCDYSMIGDELYVAAAVVKKIPDELGSVQGQDLIKMIVIILAAVSVVLATAGSKLYAQLIGM